MDNVYVLSGHLHSSGFIRKGRTAIKALDVVGSSSAGLLEIWDSPTAPVTSGTYGRSGTTVTVTDTGHGLATGDVIGISFEPDSGVIATPGNYEITVVDADTFTLTDINSGTIANDPDCRYVHGGNGEPSRWVATWHTAASDTFFNGFNIPGNGLLCRKAVYIYAANLASINVYYG
jgi:hypothetical protein